MSGASKHLPWKKKPIGGTVSYNPPRLQDAPADIKDAVMLGYNIMDSTRKYAAGYVGNELDCDNCHFHGGIAQGGRNGGLSLVGVATKYPEYRKQAKGINDLISRTNSCFEKSMNGKPLPPESKEMIALVTYYQWISKGLPIYTKIPWLGMQPIKSTHISDPANGKQVFSQQCAICHGNNALGTLRAPPLWGDASFNDGSGMNKPENLAAFAYYNMPKTNPYLTAEQALATIDETRKKKAMLKWIVAGILIQFILGIILYTTLLEKPDFITNVSVFTGLGIAVLLL